MGNDDTQIGDLGSNVISDNYAVSTYRSFLVENNSRIELVAGIGQLRLATKRIDGIETLTGKRTGHQFFTSITYRDGAIKRNKWTLSPYGRVALSQTLLNQFSESGGTNAITYLTQKLDYTEILAGTDMNYLLPIKNDNAINLQAKFEYGLDVSGANDAVLHYNTESKHYTLDTAKAAKDNMKISLGATLIGNNNLQATINYTRQQGSSGSRYSDGIKLRLGGRF